MVIGRFGTNSILVTYLAGSADFIWMEVGVLYFLKAAWSNTCRGLWRQSTACLVALWAIALFAGNSHVGVHDTSPIAFAVAGVNAILPSPVTTGMPMLRLFLHPRRPCSIASLEELSRLMVAGNDKRRTDIVVYEPAPCPEGWQRFDAIARWACTPATHADATTHTPVFGCATYTVAKSNVGAK